MAGLAPGVVGEKKIVVTETLTARHLGSGRVAVLATPAMITLMEQASLESVEPFLEPGQQTVGTLVNVRHLAATPQGMTVRIRTELLEVNGRRLTFRVEAFDESEKVSEGTHERSIIDVNRFQSKVEAKLEASRS